MRGSWFDLIPSMEICFSSKTKVALRKIQWNDFKLELLYVSVEVGKLRKHPTWLSWASNAIFLILTQDPDEGEAITGNIICYNEGTLGFGRSWIGIPRCCFLLFLFLLILFLLPILLSIPLLLFHSPPFLLILPFFSFALLGIKYRECWANPQPFLFPVYWNRILLSCPDGLKSVFSYLSLLGSWNYSVHHHPWLSISNF